MNTAMGSAKKRIIEEAANWRADLVVFGSPGHSFLSRFFLGSVSEAVVRQAPCSFLVVREEIDSGPDNSN